MQSAATSAPLPTVNQLLEHLREHQKEVERVRQNYIFVVDEEEQEALKNSGFRTVETNTYEIRYNGPWEVTTLIARNGQPLSSADPSKNREQSDRMMRMAQQSLSRLASDPLAEGSSLNISDFLAADDLTNMRREDFQSHHVLIFDFFPRPDFKPESAKAKFLKSLAGTIWVDEQAVQLIRLQAHLINNVSYGGVLVSVKKGLSIVMEQRKVNNEIWLPSYSEFHGETRAFLSHDRANLVRHYRDYRRFRVGSVVKPLEEGDPAPGEAPQPAQQPQGSPQR